MEFIIFFNKVLDFNLKLSFIFNNKIESIYNKV